MDINQLIEAAAPNTLAGYLARLPQPHHPGHGTDGAIETQREDKHAGHSIVIRTTYRIEVDGQMLQTPLTLGNDGCVPPFTQSSDTIVSIYHQPTDFVLNKCILLP